ncbi:hypothetical protein [Granulicella sp. S190]|uniref:hypothetical protein n=1 Tax=Granulicella sp. S190 TaxID=1747226 RepID=UPI00131CAFBA|nr:hypothetical protein [Granulicella sp. S190]
MQNYLLRYRFFLPVLQAALLLLFVFPALQSVVRDNDQASLVTGAMQISRHQISPLHDGLYLFDKQYGTYLLLSLVFKFFPGFDPITLGNAIQILLYGIGSILALYVAEKRGLSRRIGVTLCLVPSLILYAPFLGTSQLSLAFLLLSYPFLINRAGVKFYAGLLLLALATTMRVDAIFCVPAIYTAISARRTLRQVFMDKTMWLFVATVTIPLVIGILIAPPSIYLPADHFFVLSFYAALLVFAIGLPWLVSATTFSVFGVRAALQRRRWSTFYIVMVASVWCSLAYYSVQMYSARYFFPTFFSSFALLSSKRGRFWFRWMKQRHLAVQRVGMRVLTALSLTPWIVGVHFFSLHSGKLTLSNPTLIPTSDGVLPMGSLAAFQASLIARHGVVDQNQQSLLAARSVRYKPCPDGLVSVYFSGMSSFIMQAAEEQGLRSRILVLQDTTSSCPKGRYVELRALVRGETNVDLLLRHAMKWESAPDALRPILSVDLTSPANDTTEEIKTLVAMGRRMDFTYHALPAGGVPTNYVLEDGHAALMYTDERSCLPREGKTIAVPGSNEIWAEIAAKPVRRSIAVCAMRSGAWLPVEVPQFLQAKR